ncbi:MAG: hypothetical protein ABSF15_26590 [Candidatus Sulfotelmatobacter sp.]
MLSKRTFPLISRLGKPWVQTTEEAADDVRRSVSRCAPEWKSCASGGHVKGDKECKCAREMRTGKLIWDAPDTDPTIQKLKQRVTKKFLNAYTKHTTKAWDKLSEAQRAVPADKWMTAIRNDEMYEEVPRFVAISYWVITGKGTAKPVYRRGSEYEHLQHSSCSFGEGKKPRRIRNVLSGSPASLFTRHGIDLLWEAFESIGAPQYASPELYLPQRTEANVEWKHDEEPTFEPNSIFRHGIDWDAYYKNDYWTLTRRQRLFAAYRKTVSKALKAFTDKSSPAVQYQAMERKEVIRRAIEENYELYQGKLQDALFPSYLWKPAPAAPEVNGASYRQGLAYRDLPRPVVQFDQSISCWPDLRDREHVPAVYPSPLAAPIVDRSIPCKQSGTPCGSCKAELYYKNSYDLYPSLKGQEDPAELLDSFNCAKPYEQPAGEFGKAFFEMPLDEGQEGKMFLPHVQYKDGRVIEGSRLLGRADATLIFDKTNSTFYLQKVKQAKKPSKGGLWVGKYRGHWIWEGGTTSPNAGRKRADAKLALLSLPVRSSRPWAETKEEAASGLRIIMGFWKTECKEDVKYLRDNKELLNRFLRLVLQFCESQKNSKQFVQWVSKAFALRMAGVNGSREKPSKVTAAEARWAADQREVIQENGGITISKTQWKRFGEAKQTQYTYEGSTEDDVWKEKDESEEALNELKTALDLPREDDWESSEQKVISSI